MATKHIGADPGDFATTVVMPGDPLRARYIAERFFEGPRLVTEVRNMLGYTGRYQGVRLSVMAHGMGRALGCDLLHRVDPRLRSQAHRPRRQLRLGERRRAAAMIELALDTAARAERRAGAGEDRG